MLLSNMELIATAPGGIAKLRELILTLAVQGKLVPQNPADEPAGVLLKKIRAEKDRLVAEGKIKRDKPLAGIAEEEKPFALPQGWEWVRLSALLQKIGAGSTPLGGREVYVPSGVKFLRSQNVWDEGLRLDGVAFIKPEMHAKMAGTVVVANDLLFNITGASIGRCAVVPSDFDEANVSQHVTIIRAVLPELNAFLHKVLVSRHVQQTVMDVQVGVSREGLSIAKLGQFLIPVPPLAEQSRIVTRVEALMRLCDALEAKGQLGAAQHAQLVSTLLGTLTASTTPEELAANWQRVAQHFDLLLDRPEAIDALEQTLLQLAVRGLLVPQDPTDEPASALLQKIRAEKDRLIATGQIKRDKPLPPITDDEKPFGLPQGWEWVRVGDVVELLNGYAFKSEWFKPAGVRLLRNVNISHGHVDWSVPVMLDAIAAKSYEQFALRAGDIVLSLDRPIISTGLKYAVIRDSDLPCLLLQRVARLTACACLSSEFLQLWLKSDLFVGTIDPGRSNGVPHISTKQVAGLAFALPPLAEQSRIVTRVTALRRLCADLRQRLAEREAVQARLAEALVESVG
ncbi:restriction endonuclease subunit S [Acidovorax temperans]|uniref:restriction endonuclease subunit S n=1 Tax=Acidovorax temperans TaxID=80878 RepID=UPI001A947422|nr:restriction endonuclease subunit S [Acidovorax temperans]MBO0943442.1 restriction endonuclease subunit S [Acidovorax temperans]